MPNVINSMLLMFADDTKLYHTIDSSQDHNILQNDIDQLCVWGDRSLMSFNLDKCHVMSFGRTSEAYTGPALAKQCWMGTQGVTAGVNTVCKAH